MHLLSLSLSLSLSFSRFSSLSLLLSSPLSFSLSILALIADIFFNDLDERILPTAEQHSCCLAVGHSVWDVIPVWTPIDTTSAQAAVAAAHSLSRSLLSAKISRSYSNIFRPCCTHWAQHVELLVSSLVWVACLFACWLGYCTMHISSLIICRWFYFVLIILVRVVHNCWSSGMGILSYHQVDPTHAYTYPLKVAMFYVLLLLQ